MGDFVTNPSTDLSSLLPDGEKATAPGVSYRAGWTSDNVLRASEVNAMANALLDLRADARTVADVTYYGAEPTNSDTGPDSTQAIQDAIDSGDVAVLPPTQPGYFFRVTAPILIGAGKELVGQGSTAHARVRTYHAGSVFVLSGTRATLKHIDIDPADAVKWNYIGVKLDGSAATLAALQLSSSTNLIVEDVRTSNPRVAFWGSGAVYVSHLRSVSSYRFDDYGVLFDNTEGAGGAPQGNTVTFTELYGHDKAAETASIYTAGSVNTFIGGELAGAKYQFWAGANAVNNHVLGAFGEDSTYSVKAEAGATVHWDAHSSTQPMALDADAKVWGPSGQPLTRGNHFMQRGLRAQTDLKAAWWFAEGTGSVVYDHSGNGRDLSVLAGSSWGDTGRWGHGLLFDPANTHGVGALPLATADWTQPFTVAILALRTANLSTPAILTFMDAAGKYLRIDRASINVTVTTWNGATLGSSVLPSMQDGSDDPWSWTVVYFDPVNQTATLLDPVKGPVDFAPAPAFRPWAVGGGAGINTVSLMHNGFGTQGIQGVVSFCGIWQRRLTFAEVLELVNMRAPRLWAPGSLAIADRMQAVRYSAPTGQPLTVRGAALSTGSGVALKVTNSVDLNTSGDAAVKVYRDDGSTLILTVDRFGSVIVSGGGFYGSGLNHPTNGQKIIWGTNTPEGAIAAAVGSMFLRSNGAAGTALYVKESGTGNTGWVQSNLLGTLSGSATWDPANLVDGAGETSAGITVTGAALGDFVLVSAPYDLQGITCNGYVSAANTVRIRIQNETGGAIDLASGTWRVRVLKQ